MTAVKNTSQISAGTELRDLFNVNQLNDKKGSSGDLSSQFWELLNKLDEENQSLPAKSSMPNAKGIIRHEKSPISPIETKIAVMEDNAVKQDEEEISPLQQEDFTSPATMTELFMVRPQQLIDRGEKKTTIQGMNGSKDKGLDIRGDEAFLKGVREPVKLKQDLGKENLLPTTSVEGTDETVLPEKNIHDNLLKQVVAKGREESKIQFEMMSKPMDFTPLQVRHNTNPQDKQKLEGEIILEEIPTDGENSQLLSMPTKTKQALGMEKGVKDPDARGKENAPSSSSPPLSPLFVKTPGMMEAAPAASKSNNSTHFMVASASKGAEQVSGKSGIIAAKKMTSVEKIQMLNQIRSELKATLEKGETHLKVHLVPDELGKVEIKLDIDRNGTVQVLFTADQRETMEHIARHGHEFVQIFQESGLQADLSSMNFQSRQQHQEGSDLKESRKESFSVASVASQETHPVKLRRPTTQIDIEV